MFLIFLFPATILFAAAESGPTAPAGTIELGPTAPAGSHSAGFENPLKYGSITELFAAILNVVLVFAIPLVAFFIIYAGFLYVTARGNETTITQAHKALLYAVIGGVLILGANVLITVIQNTVDAIK